MSSFSPCLSVALLGAALVFAAVPSGVAQTPPDQKQPDQPPKPPGTPPSEAGKDDKKKIDEFGEAARVLGGPAARPECLWIGRNVVSLLWRNDLDTALRQLEVYDRFGCPNEHVQHAYRCVLLQGQKIEAPEKLIDRVHACWINPSLAPVVATPASPSGTSNQ